MKSSLFEKKISKNFINNGYVILPALNLSLLNIFKKKIETFLKKNHKINISRNINDGLAEAIEISRKITK